MRNWLYLVLKVEAFSYLGYGNAEVNVDLPVEYDLVKVYVNDVEVGTLDAPTVGSNTVAISDFFEFKGAEVKIVGNIASVDYESRKFDTEEIDVAPQIFSFESAIDGDVYPVSIEVENNEPFDKVEVLFNDEVVYTDEQILTEGDAARVINFDYDQQGINRLQIRAHIQGEIYITDADS